MRMLMISLLIYENFVREVRRFIDVFLTNGIVDRSSTSKLRMSSEYVCLRLCSMKKPTNSSMLISELFLLAFMCYCVRSTNIFSDFFSTKTNSQNMFTKALAASSAKFWLVSKHHLVSSSNCCREVWGLLSISVAIRLILSFRVPPREMI